MSTRMRGAQRRVQLLEVALEVFGREGYHATSMNRVADAAGVTKPVLCRQFDSKHDLFGEVIELVGDQLWRRISAATTAADSPREQVERGFDEFFGFFAESPASFRVLFGDGTRSDPIFAKTVERVETRIAGTIAALITIDDLTPEDRMLLASGIAGLAEGTARELMRREVTDTRRVAALVTELAWAGLRGA